KNWKNYRCTDFRDRVSRWLAVLLPQLRAQTGKVKSTLRREDRSSFLLKSGHARAVFRTYTHTASFRPFQTIFVRRNYPRPNVVRSRSGRVKRFSCEAKLSMF